MKQKTKNTNSLIKFDTDWWNNACVNYSDNPWNLYARGYHDALEVLIEHLLENSSATIDTLVYPVIFLYHQYLELRLKEIILLGNKLLERPYKISKEHNIARLWRTARLLLQEIEPNGSKIDLDAIEVIIKEFSSVDPESMTFRYPVNLDGSPTLEPNITHINIRNFADVMGEVISNLEGMSVMISVYQGYQDEQNSYYQQENSEYQDDYY